MYPPPPVKIVIQVTTKGSICSEMFRGAAHQKLKKRLKGVSISRNVRQNFSKNQLIHRPNQGGQLRPKYPISEGLMHTNVETTQIYLKSFENSLLDEMNKRLVTKLYN